MMKGIKKLDELRCLMPDDETIHKAAEMLASPKVLVQNVATKRQTCASSKKPSDTQEFP